MKVICIKSIKLFDKTLFAKGSIIDTEEKPSIAGRIPVTIDYTNKEYFKEFVQDFVKGDYVSYNTTKGKLYGEVIKFDHHRKEYSVRLENGSIINTKVGQLVKAFSYFFINSEGEVHKQIAGKNKKRDNFCRLANIMFETKEDATKRLREIQARS